MITDRHEHFDRVETVTKRVEFHVAARLLDMQEATRAAISELVQLDIDPADYPIMWRPDDAGGGVLGYEVEVESPRPTTFSVNRLRLARALDSPEETPIDELIQVARQRTEWFSQTWRARGYAGVSTGIQPPIPALLPRDWPRQVAAIVDSDVTTDHGKIQQLHSLLDRWVLNATTGDDGTVIGNDPCD